MNHSPLVPQCGKIGHPSRKVAVVNLRRVLDGLHRRGKGHRSLHVYLCAVCSLFHTGNSTELESTTRPQRRSRAADKFDPAEGDDE